MDKGNTPADIHIPNEPAVKPSMVLLSVLPMVITTSGCWQVTTVTSNAEEQAEPSVQKTVTTADKATTETKQKANDDSNSPSEKTSLVTKPITKSQSNVVVERKTMNVTNTGSIEGGESVQYNTEAWSKKEVKPLTIKQVSRLPEEIAQVRSIDENSLDYASHPAIKYRFMKSNAPYFDLVDSNEYLEIGWYYANPHDTDDEKNSSISHARKAHKFARQVMGNEGGEVVADMLVGNSLQNKKINGTEVTLAKCQFYSCMLVLKKPKEIPTDSSSQILTTAETEVTNSEATKPPATEAEKKTSTDK